MRARYGDALDRKYNLGGQSLDAVAPVVQPTWPVDEFSMAERYLVQYRSFICGVSTAAVAAEFSTCRIRNPAGSGVLAIIEGIQFYSSAAATNTVQLAVGYILTDLAGLPTAGAYQPRDMRIGTAGLTTTRGACNVTADSVLAALQLNGGVASMSMNRGASPAATFELFDGDGLFVLSPGSALEVYSATVNVFAQAMFWWRERPFADLEQ